MTQDYFSGLSPETILTGAERATGEKFTGLISPLPSYINRVYELLSFSGERFIAKFYRPGRWTKEAICDEHLFVGDCHADEIPVVAPLTLSNDTTLMNVSGYLMALFPKRSGREMELNSGEDWHRIGVLIARMHQAGMRGDAPHRITWAPQFSTRSDIDFLRHQNLVTPRHIQRFDDVCNKLLDCITPMFEDVDIQRIHGDCHKKNILHRPGEGTLMIDFDDMMTGPPIQDIWLLLPGTVNECRSELNNLIDGYETFRPFDDLSLRLVEPLRAMRIIYFLAWCGKQVHDNQFQQTFPNWGDDAFWQREINDLEKQLAVIEEGMKPRHW